MSKRIREGFWKKYPNLIDELGSRGTLRIDAVRSSRQEAEKAAHSLHGYEPTAVDFIRRCDTQEQAFEIIDFLETNGSIESAYAKRLREQLASQGLRSFGPKKKPGYYQQG
jgi:hypothetical protein